MPKRIQWIAILALARCATQLPPGSPLADLAGTYVERVRLNMLDDPEQGHAYNADDKFVIRRVDATHAKVDVGLYFTNGHQCGIGGMAVLEGNHLLLREPTDNGVCSLTISRKPNFEGVPSIVLDVLPDSTCYVFCGMRGSLDGASLPLSSRRRR